MVRSDLAEIPEFRKRFSRELDVARRIRSPRVAEIYNAQTEGPRPWLATEYVPGPTLQDAIDKGGSFDSRRLRALAVAIAEALRVIHAAEVVHRDLKPANVLCGPDGPKVINFGSGPGDPADPAMAAIPPKRGTKRAPIYCFNDQGQAVN